MIFCHTFIILFFYFHLGIANVGGVFVVLLFGCMFALIVAICEFMWNVKKVAVEEKITPFEALKSELSFALNLSITTKPVHNKTSEEGSKSAASRSLKSQSPQVSHNESEHETRSIMNAENDTVIGGKNAVKTLSKFSKIANLFGRKFNQ